MLNTKQNYQNRSYYSRNKNSFHKVVDSHHEVVHSHKPKAYQSLVGIKLIPSMINKFNVHLNLGFQTRFIGELDTTGEGTFTCQRKEELHLFRKMNSLGLNYELLTNKKIPFKWIVVVYYKADGSRNLLVTSRDYFLHYGKCFKFDRKGFELQCFLPIELFGIDKARQFEALNSLQMNLFNRVEK